MQKLLLFAFFLSVFFLTNVSGNLTDFPVSVLIQKHSQKDLSILSKGEILSGEKIAGRFKATENNLGILSVRFINRFRDSNTDVLSFRLKEIGANDWYYQNTYRVDQFRSHDLFPFGFPAIIDSRGREYYFEIESLYGKMGNASQLSLLEPVFVTKYKFSKVELLQDKKALFIFAVKKITGYLSIYEILAAIAISFIPYFLHFMRASASGSGLTFLHPSPTRPSTSFGAQRAGRARGAKFPFFILIVIFLVTFVVAGLFATLEIDPAHDGIMLKPAIDMVEGKMLFRDTFTQYGALTTIIQAAGVAIFGKYVLVIRLLTAFFYACISVFLFLILTRFIPKWLVALTIFIWIATSPYLYNIFTPWSSVYALFFQLFSLYLLFIYLEKGEKKYVFFAGVSTAFTFWCRQPVGVFLFLAYLSYFLISGRKFWLCIIHFLSGVMLATSIFFLWLWLNQALGEWYRQSIYSAFVFGRSFGQGYRLQKIFASLFPAGFHLYALLWFILPIISLAFFIYILGKLWAHGKLDLSSHKLLAFLLVGLASWMQYFPVAENWHFYYGSTLFMGITVVFVSQLSGKLLGKNSRILFLLGILYLIFVPVAGFRTRLAVIRLTDNYVQVNSPKVAAGLKLYPSDGPFFLQLGQITDNYLKNHSGTNLVTTSDPLYLTFKENNENFHPIYVNWDFIKNSVYPDYKEKLNNYIKDKHPLIISKSTELFDGYCQLTNADHAFNIAVKAYDEGNHRFDVVGSNFDNDGSITIKLTPGEEAVEDIIIEEVQGSKVRRWNAASIRKNDSILSVQIPTPISKDAKLIVKILFTRNNCYVEKAI